MDFSFTPEQEAVRSAVERICARFGDDYWLKKDKEGGFPHDFHKAFADDGWLGICVPQEYGGAGCGVTEAVIMMQTIAASGAGLSGASALHMNIFGLNPVVVFGTEEQKRRMLPPLIAGQDKACFAVTEPNVGDVTVLQALRDLRRDENRDAAEQQQQRDDGNQEDVHARAFVSTRRVNIRIAMTTRPMVTNDCGIHIGNSSASVVCPYSNSRRTMP